MTANCSHFRQKSSSQVFRQAAVDHNNLRMGRCLRLVFRGVTLDDSRVSLASILRCRASAALSFAPRRSGLRARSWPLSSTASTLQLLESSAEYPLISVREGTSRRRRDLFDLSPFGFSVFGVESAAPLEEMRYSSSPWMTMPYPSRCFGLGLWGS